MSDALAEPWPGESTLPPLRRARSVRVAASFVALSFLAYGFIPQFGGPGYESALAAGLLLPATSALCVSFGVAGRRVTPLAAFGRGISVGFCLAVLGALIVFGHGLRVGLCDVGWGLELYLLGPTPGALLAGVWGALVGLLSGLLRAGFRRRTACIAGALAGPLCGIGFSLGRFYTSPMVFAFDPFFGYFAGPLYDTVIDAFWTLATYRAGTLLTLLSLGISASFFDAQLRFRGLADRSWLAGVGLCASLGSAALSYHGTSLGHFSTRASIEAALGQQVYGARCDVKYSSAISRRDALLFARDCDAELSADEAYFEIQGPARVTAFLFANEGEKGRLMGASSTYIAKPWRREIYVQASAYPHPVVGHELAHVLAGSFGQGPFRVSGPLGGWIPDPGRIEGIAVAASPNDNDDFTLDEWAKTLLDLALLPPLSSVFRLGFLGQNSSTAYTVAGAFVHWFHDRYGAAAVRRWYGGEPIERVSGQSFAALEAAWRADLARVNVAPALLEAARVRFDRPSLFGRHCPRIVDKLNGVANQKLGSGDTAGARRTISELLRLDPHHTGAKFVLAVCEVKEGDEAAALAAYAKLATSPELAKLERASAREAQADVELRAGRSADAQRDYDAVASIVADEDRLRTLDVKRSPQNELQRRAIVDLLVGDPLLGAAFEVAAPRLAEWADAEPENGLPSYLLGKNLFGRGRFLEAADYLDQALTKKLSLPRVVREAWRTRLTLACALGDGTAKTRALTALRGDLELSSARRAAVERLAARCLAR
ncbi:MAG TPA: tetratricopeptide repeat protein [Polyangiaceae bacterium]|nr:tetratricopeptide repeat protein [Polyangiaceae bacterium]